MRRCVVVLLMRRRSVLCIGALLLLLAPSAAFADTVRSMPLNDLQPADGLTRVASSYPSATDAEMFDFVVDTPMTPAPTQVVIEVSTSNLPGQDGTLADDFRQDFRVAYRSDAYPTRYSARTRTYDGWLAKPGTYYWQAYATVYDYASGCNPCQYLTPVRTITITPKPAPPPTPTPPPTTPPGGPAPTGGGSTDYFMTLSNARTYVRGIIKKSTSHTPSALTYKCRRLDFSTFRCQPAWVDKKWVYAGMLNLIDEGDTIRYRFNGIRATRTCMQATHNNAKKCAKRVVW
jgi:hypothetical protein